MPRNEYTNWIFANPREYPSEEISIKEYGIVAAEALVLRIIVLIVAAIALRLFMEDSIVLTWHQYLNEWQKWDALHYLRIAEGGYTGYYENGQPILLVFFPLYSLLVKGTHLLVHDYQLSAMIVSILCYIAGCCYFYGFVSLEYGKQIAKKAVFYISIFPFSFYFGAMMTESLFYLTVCACLYYIRKHNWVMVALVGIMAGLTRMQGVLLVIPAGVEWVEFYKPFELLRQKKWREVWKVFYTKALWIPCMGLGPLIYLFCNYKVTGKPFQFLVYQKEIWFHGPEYFGKALISIVNYLNSKNHVGMTMAAIWIPEAMVFVLSVGLMIYAVRKHPNKYVLFLLLYTIMNYSLSFIISGARYMTVAVPMFIFVAELSERHKWLDKWITVISLLLMGIYLNGYLFAKQIM